MRYVVLTLHDARAVARGEISEKNRRRLLAEEGADMEEIARALKQLPVCGACLIEGVAHGCESLDARRLGRRLDRLLKRARCEVMPGEKVP